ncbi:S-layer homology domain-containing protein [Anaerotalea alkaliphila]|uniref:S-layer homology domain-containing protein n=1 Tax=Anaerotalea alkaliphila TaxID=2662126 RepID=A0A7X5HVA7_9FIRM|nr:S-layer homology domain-containing protein [Anaerotalea alkaliphila]NDL67269.1 S-layer homology domain-containing protein [Anaerotalea alkaliphila]
MQGRFVRLFALLLAWTLAVSGTAPGTAFGPASTVKAADPPLVLDGTQSAWAEVELFEAHGYGLTVPAVMNRFRQPITREEFSILAVKLYEGITGKKAVPGANTFQDTSNPEVLKAYNLGIVKGLDATTFAPQRQITRQEICVMIYRALDVSIAGLDKDTSGDFPFADQGSIAAWALTEMRFAYRNQIMKGVGNNRIGPLENTTREQAIVLLKRTYVQYAKPDRKGVVEGTVQLQKPPLLGLAALGRYRALDGSGPVFPRFDEKLKLYASTGTAKPLARPTASLLDQLQTSVNLIPAFPIVLGGARYTDADFGAFVDKDISSRHWFSYVLAPGADAKNVVWQVATAPFAGGVLGWKTPTGLKGRGEVAATAGEFQIDFANLGTGSFVLASAYKPIPQDRTPYYVRAVPVDGFGNPVGEPGTGMAVLCGIRTAEPDPTKPVAASFQVWTPLSPQGKFSGENMDLPTYRPVVGVDPRSSERRIFHLNGLDGTLGTGLVKIGIQVSTQPFPSQGGGWPDTPNLVHEELHDLPVPSLATAYPNSLLVDFTSFAKPASAMEEGKHIRYHLRGVALKAGLEPGTWEVLHSSPVTIDYGWNPPVTWYSDSPYTKVEVLKHSLPDLEIVDYTPVRWQATDYLHHYYVFQAPTAHQILNKWKNQDGYVLYPYILHEAYYASRGIRSAQEYESKEIPKVLPVGAKVYFPPPKEEQKAWYEQLYEGVVGFFEDLFQVTKELANQVSKAYADLKTGLVAHVVALCPVESLKGPFRTALEGLVNYGLMTLGVPPTLPNFDQLTDMSLDYLAEVALTEAGVPVTEWSKDLVEDVAQEIGEQMVRATSHADRNPVDAPFLKLDPDHLYRPASLRVRISNPTGVPSIPGTFNLHTTFEMDNHNIASGQTGLHLSVDTNYSVHSAAGTTVATQYSNHFLYGLNGGTVRYTQGDKAVYDVFNPQVGVKVPRLLAGEVRVLTVHLNPYDGGRMRLYPEGENIRSLDFENMYFHNGNKKFTHFSLVGRFPTAREYLLQQGMFYLDPKTDYAFEKQAYQKAGQKLQKPVNAAW